MVIPAVIIAAFIAVIIGVVTAVRQYSILDHTLTGFAYLFYSAPVFVIAILLKDFLATDVNKAVGHTMLYTIGESTPGVTGAWPTFTNIARPYRAARDHPGACHVCRAGAGTSAPPCWTCSTPTTCGSPAPRG